MIAEFRPTSRVTEFAAMGLSGLVAFLALTTAPSMAASEATGAAASVGQSVGAMSQPALSRADREPDRPMPTSLPEGTRSGLGGEAASRPASQPDIKPVALPATQPASSPAVEVNLPRIKKFIVPSTANIYGAGHQNLPAPAGGGGGTPPVCIRISPTRANTPLSFGKIEGKVTGDHNHFHQNGPDGGRESGGSTVIPAFDGLSGTKHGGASHFLVGVFLTADEPRDPAPDTLDFTASTSFTDLHPKLGQIFFIGDGLTAAGTGLPQRFYVPAGTKRLFLGFADAWASQGLPGWYDDNAGALLLEIELQPDEQ